jgi:hypothetical protein
MKLQPSQDDYVQDLAVVHSCSHLSTYPSQSNHCCLQVLTNVCIVVQGFISLWCYFRPLSGVGQVSFCAHYLKVQQPPYQHGTVRVHCLLYLQNLSMYDKFPCYVGSNIQKLDLICQTCLTAHISFHNAVKMQTVGVSLVSCQAHQRSNEGWSAGAGDKLPFITTL